MIGGSIKRKNMVKCQLWKFRYYIRMGVNYVLDQGIEGYWIETLRPVLGFQRGILSNFKLYASKMFSPRGGVAGLP